MNKKRSLCAPFIDSDIKKYSKKVSNLNILKSVNAKTCFTNDILKKIALSWNNDNPEDKIIYNEKINGNLLWKLINDKMRGKCTNEICWSKHINNNKLRNDMKRYFKPIMPTSWLNNPREWLSSVDLSDVMTQYETKFKDFKFIGPVPIDFDTKINFGSCIVNELCKLKLINLFKKKIYQIGIIFNLDKHNESGSHWVALYINLHNKLNKGLFYWDSYGINPVNEITELMTRLQQQSINDLHFNLPIHINDIRHQYKNSECGVYCLYFLISLLEGKKYNYIISNIIKDDDMNSNRSKFFIKI